MYSVFLFLRHSRPVAVVCSKKTYHNNHMKSAYNFSSILVIFVSLSISSTWSEEMTLGIPVPFGSNRGTVSPFALVAQGRIIQNPLGVVDGDASRMDPVVVFRDMFEAAHEDDLKKFRSLNVAANDESLNSQFSFFKQLVPESNEMIVDKVVFFGEERQFLFVRIGDGLKGAFGFERSPSSVLLHDLSLSMSGPVAQVIQFCAKYEYQFLGTSDPSQWEFSTFLLEHVSYPVSFKCSKYYNLDSTEDIERLDQSDEVKPGQVRAYFEAMTAIGSEDFDKTSFSEETLKRMGENPRPVEFSGQETTLVYPLTEGRFILLIINEPLNSIRTGFVQGFADDRIVIYNHDLVTPLDTLMMIDQIRSQIFDGLFDQ